jgi:tetratricopeptide (TPR) repeat protein
MRIRPEQPRAKPLVVVVGVRDRYAGAMLRGICAAALVCVLASAAYADNKEAAKQAYTEGKRQYDLGEYDAALSAFKTAYLNYEEPVFLFNIAQCYRALGDRPAAVRTYRAFLRNWPKAPNREQVDRIITELERAIEQDKTAKAAPPQETLAPGARPAEASSKAPPPTTPPPATAEKPGVATAPATTAPVAPPPATTTTTEPKPQVAHKTPPPSDDLAGMVEVEPNFDRPSGSSKPLKWWAWTLIAVGVAGVGAAVAVLAITQTSSSHFDSTLPDYTSRGLGVTSVRF